MSGAGWASYVFRTNGAEVQFQITAREVQLPLQLGAFVYDNNSGGLGDKLVFSWTHLLMDTDTGVFADTQLPPSPPLHIDTRLDQSGREFVTLTVTMNDANNEQGLLGKYRLLMWTTGTVAATDFSLTGKGGSVYLGHETGDDTFLYTSTDFRGPLNVQVGTGSTEGRVDSGLSLPLTVEDTLIGLFYPVNTPSDVDDLRVDTPEGERECPCFFNAFTEDFQGNPAEAGDYLFHIDGAHFDTGTESEIILAGADARLSAQSVQE